MVGTDSISNKIGESNSIDIVPDNIKVASKNINLLGGETSSVSAKKTTIEGKAKATVTSSGPTSVQGSILKLN